MDFENISDLINHGFRGFVTVAELQRSACRDVPNEQGVYLVVRPTIRPPEFLSQSTGGHFKDKAPTVSVAELQRQWVAGPKVIYVGKAGSSSGTTTLRSRLRSYMRFGLGKPVGHWGGRYIWQLADASDLQVCWKPTPNEDPAVIESQLIQAFQAMYGKRPFANLRD